MSKALRVCATCKTRKKACDKCLPICGYCAKRSLTCIYYEEEEGHYYPQTYGTDPPTTTTVSTIDDLVHGQLRYVVSLMRVSIREMIEEFFQGIYTVFPVVYADDALWSSLSAYEEDQQVVSADVALVVLAMYLLTMRSSSQDNHDEQTTSIETVYIATKRLLGHVQALGTSSIYLVQATLLVAAFEYACCRPHVAYVSIGVCSRMAMLLTRGSHPNQRNLRKVLGEHVFGGLVLLERLVACEVDIPFTPSLGSYQRSTKVEHENQHTTIADSEEREKALHLLDRVLLLTKSPDDQEQTRVENLSALQKISVDLQNFLSDALNSTTRTTGADSCIVIATAIRSLFSLHQHILDTLTTTTSNNTPTTIIRQIQEISLNALDTATRIMIDTSHDHVEYGVPHASETFPLCGGYNLRCAMAHLKRYGAKETRYRSQQRDIDSDLARLEDLYVAFCRRWKPFDYPRY